MGWIEFIERGLLLLSFICSLVGIGWFFIELARGRITMKRMKDFWWHPY